MELRQIDVLQNCAYDNDYDMETCRFPRAVWKRKRCAVSLYAINQFTRLILVSLLQRSEEGIESRSDCQYFYRIRHKILFFLVTKTVMSQQWSVYRAALTEC